MEETLPAEPVPGEAPPENWERYQLGPKLGEGGMGIVYRATDRTLGRDVAIKLIRGGNPTLALRLLKEARAQARIDHPGVCRVYDVGEIGGRGYIALQLVEGESLAHAARRMTLDEKVAVMRDVALAIHEAHRLGIIHRDLKPGNVMVERGDDGRWQPIVMDFGLAREVTVELGMTETGALLGTPAYMSPEQARGDLRAIDRRSDVYSLGATLYELVTGGPPFATGSLAGMLDHVIHHEPVAPRKLVPGLPADVETMTLKCMRKDPAQRYASAKALADDLTRYLDGEPIEGRRRSVAQRVRESVRRHRALYAIGAASLLAVLTAGTFGLRERWRSEDRAQLAERLSRDARDIQLLAQTSYQLPLHDTRPERLVIRTRMLAIAMTPHDLGSLGDGMIHDALGRGHMALHEWSEAVAELDRASQDGLDVSSLHAARGRALGELYHRAVEEARRGGDKKWFADQEKQLAAQYLTPALSELDRARDSPDTGGLLEATIALYRHDYATAKAKSLDVARTTPWLYESTKLAADAVYAAAAVEVDRGNYDVARPQLDEANRLYMQAADAARSDATMYEAAAQARLERAEIDLRQNQSSNAVLDEMRRLIEQAVEANPSYASAFTTKAHILLFTWRAKGQNNSAMLPLLEETAAAAENAVRLDPKSVLAWDALGNAYVVRGTYEDYRGGNAVPWWRRSLVEYENALALRPNDPWVNNDAGVAHRWLAQAASATGNPMPEFEASAAAFRKATIIDPNYLYAWSNDVDVLAQLAEYQVGQGIDPRDTVSSAIESGERGLALDPNYDMLLKWMADVRLREAEYCIATNTDPSTAIESARAYLNRADLARPRNMTTWWLRARAARFATQWLLSIHQDAAREVAKAREANARVLELAPSAVAGWVEHAELDLAIGDLNSARAEAAKAMSVDGSDDNAYLVAADIERAFAIRFHDVAALGRGLQLLGHVLTANPRSPRARSIQAALIALKHA